MMAVNLKSVSVCFNKLIIKNGSLDYVKMFFLCFSFAILTILITYSVYYSTTKILTERLQSRLISIASTAATSFSAEDIEVVRDRTSLNSTEYKKLVNQLFRIKEANNDVMYAYLMRRTNDINKMEFIADALALSPLSVLDENSNGILDEDETPPMPGDVYDANDYPVLKNEAFFRPSADYVLQSDKWGLMMSAYAPILNQAGDAIAIVGVDVVVGDFYAITRATFIPFVLLISFLVFLLFLLTLILMRFFSARVAILQDLDRQKDELLGMVSHQLAKPITAIKWNLESMIDGDIGALTPEQKESAGTMQSMATNLADLVSMILDVSRIQLGKVKLDPQPLDLNEFFREIVSVVEPTIKEKKISFVQDIYPQKLPTVLLDKRYTRMSIENLLTNAIKYTPEGGTVKLWVQVTNNTLHCSVSDTGCGIPKAEQDKIFGKMYRASNVRNTMDGNGFGLYVAKGAVEGQGGRIWFQSIEGKGTTFFVDLPAKDAQITA